MYNQECNTNTLLHNAVITCLQQTLFSVHKQIFAETNFHVSCQRLSVGRWRTDSCFVTELLQFGQVGSRIIHGVRGKGDVTRNKPAWICVFGVEAVKTKQCGWQCWTFITTLCTLLLTLPIRPTYDQQPLVAPVTWT
jgi:hypothetical protein